MKTQQQGLIYLDNHTLTFYGGNITTNILRLDLPTNIVKDLEVINSDELNIFIKAFIEFHKITPANIILILSRNIYFEKDLLLPQDSLQAPEIQKFLDSIPFENIGSKTYQLPPGTRIVAVNRQLSESIKNAFEKQGFRIEAVIPEFVLRRYINLKDGLDLEAFRATLEKFALFKQDSLLTDYNILNENQDLQNKPGLAIQKHLILLILMIILLSLLGVLIFILR